MLYLLLTADTCDLRQRTVLTILGEASGSLQSMEDIKNDCETAINAELEFKPNSFEEAFQKANDDFAKHTGYYDIVLQYNFSMASFARNHYVYTVDELTTGIPVPKRTFESDIFDNAWKETGYYYKDPFTPSESDLVVVGYPFAANTMLLVYNKEMFDAEANKTLYHQQYPDEELVPPTTWEQFRRVAEFFSSPGKNLYGVCLTGADGGWLYYEYCNILYGQGGAIFKKDWGWEGNDKTPIVLNDSAGIAATNFYKGLKRFNCGDFLNTKAGDQVEMMKRGNVAMAIMWSDYLYSFTFDRPDIPDKKFGFAPVPGKKSPLAGGVFYVNRQTIHKEEAAKYILNIMQPANQVKLAKKGLCSPLRSVYDDPDVRQIPYSAALKKSLDRGTYMFEAGPEGSLTQEIITKYLQQFWISDRLAADSILNMAAKEIQTGREAIYRSLKSTAANYAGNRK